MKLSELKPPEQLDEISLKHAIAAGATALSLASPIGHEKVPPQKPKVVHQVDHKKIKIEKLLTDVLDNYKISKEEALKIVKLAVTHEHPTFPTARDILAIIGIESEFNDDAKSKLKNDPALGLMQVRPETWDLDETDLDTPEKQIKVGSEILKKYFDRLHDKDKAVHAYNVGITNLKNRKHLNPGYVRKYKAELKLYEDTLLESTINQDVYSLDDLKGATEPVNVTGDVELFNMDLIRLPVKFGNVGRDFWCSRNQLTSLEGAPSQVGGVFYCSDNQLTSLVGIHKIIKSCQEIFISKNPIKEGGLGLLLIKDLKYIDSELPALQIIKKYLGKGKRGMIDCQTELIKAGYKEFAKL